MASSLETNSKERIDAIKVVETLLAEAHAQTHDKRWRYALVLDGDSRWFEARHPADVVADRAELKDLVETVNRVKVGRTE